MKNLNVNPNMFGNGSVLSLSMNLAPSVQIQEIPNFVSNADKKIKESKMFNKKKNTIALRIFLLAALIKVLTACSNPADAYQQELDDLIAQWRKATKDVQTKHNMTGFFSQQFDLSKNALNITNTATAVDSSSVARTDDFRNRFDQTEDPAIIKDMDDYQIISNTLYLKATGKNK